MLLPCSCFSLVADLIADLLFVSGYQGWQPEVKASIGSSHLESGDLQSDLDAIQSMQSFMADSFRYRGPLSGVSPNVRHAGMPMTQVTDRRHAEFASRAMPCRRRGETRNVGRATDKSHLLAPGGIAKAEDVLKVVTSEPLQLSRHQCRCLVLFAA